MKRESNDNGKGKDKIKELRFAGSYTLRAAIDEEQRLFEMYKRVEASGSNVTAKRMAFFAWLNQFQKNRDDAEKS